jgi:hypothetical protein
VLTRERVSHVRAGEDAGLGLALLRWLLLVLLLLLRGGGGGGGIAPRSA